MKSASSNVLLLIWDACRYDYAREHATNLLEFGKENLWFKTAVAPAPWSPPSHASIFTGRYPHQHGMGKVGQALDSTTLTEKLSSSGYTCYGVSANGFACQRTGFHTGFDEFYYSRGREYYPEGLNTSGYALSRIYEGDGKLLTGLKIGKRILAHEHKLKSIVNTGAVGLGSASVRSELLQRIPHRLFISDSGYNYSPEVNTRRLIDIIERESQTQDPFFAFANYMDTHRPYIPPKHLQKKHVGRELPQSEIRRLNDNVAEPWEFIAADQNDEIDDEDIEIIKRLYASEVERVDKHLGRLLDTLHETGEFKDTIIIVTSDHGENLGERDSMGRRRIGHESSISKYVTHVPLVIGHPEIENDEVAPSYSLIRLFDVISNSSDIISKGSVPIMTDEPAYCQYPASGGEGLYDAHPNIPKKILNHRVSQNSVVAYHDNWRVALETTGDRWAFKQGTKIDFDKSPDKLSKGCQRCIDRLCSENRTQTLSTEQQTQLESLGYM
jgi:hypothetical protein